MPPRTPAPHAPARAVAYPTRFNRWLYLEAMVMLSVKRYTRERTDREVLNDDCEKQAGL